MLECIFADNRDPRLFSMVIWALWNGQGLAMASLSQWIPLPFTVIEVEALAAQRAVEFVAEIGLDRVIVEGDS